MVVQANQQKIKGFVKIQSSTLFGIIKYNDRLWSWLTKNRVFVQTMQLDKSCHVNIGWIINSHAEYSYQELARADLQRRIGRGKNDFELVLHTSSHVDSEGTKITTKSLRVRAYLLRLTTGNIQEFIGVLKEREGRYYSCQNI